MKRKPNRKGKHSHAKTVLRLPDLEVAKAAVINGLSCPYAQRGYRQAIDEFVDWCCSETRLSFSKTVVVRTECTWNRGTCAKHNQSPPRCGTPPCIRGSGLWAFNPRTWLREYGVSGP